MRSCQRFPARRVDEHWPAAGEDRRKVLQLVSSIPSLSECQVDLRRRGLPVLLDWLEEQPGHTWQERWLSSGADAAGEEWAQGPSQWLESLGQFSINRLALMTSSLLIMVGADVVRPSLSWLLTGGKKRKLARNMIRSRDPASFEQLRLLCESDAGITPQAGRDTLFRCAVIIGVIGFERGRRD